MGPCRSCGEPIPGRRRAVCSEGCRLFWHRTPVVLGKQLVTIVCSVCAKPYETAGGKRSTAYCSKRCGDVARLRRTWMPEIRACEVCAVEFAAHNRLQMYCSRKCRYRSTAAVTAGRRKDQIRRIRKRTGCGDVAYIDTTEVARIHRWVCGICASPIDQQLRYPDPGSLSLDHVLPLALGGAHALGNVQPAHLMCNIRKGAQDLTKAVT